MEDKENANKVITDNILIDPFLMDNVKHLFNFNVHTVANNT